MQSMQMLTQREPNTVEAQAICDREGQVLFRHAAPLGLSVGDYVTDRMTAGERRFSLGLPPETDAICLCRSTALLCRRRVWGGMLVQCLPLAAPPRAVGAVGELAAELGLALSPGMAALCGCADPGAEDAAAELIRLCGIGGLPQGDGWSAERLLAHLAQLPPICTRQLILQGTNGVCLDGAWPLLLYGLAAFLCRSTDGSALCLTLDGQPQWPQVLLSALASVRLPTGRSRLEPLAAHFPDAPELAICSRLAAVHGITVEISANGAGELCIAAQRCPDPAVLGLKQPFGLTDGAEEAAEAEWCRLLRDAVQAER